MSPKRKPSKSNAAASTGAAGKRATSPRPDEMPPEVLEFITAIDEYKRLNGKPFPSWTEILEILKGLGYERVS